MILIGVLRKCGPKIVQIFVFVKRFDSQANAVYKNSSEIGTFPLTQVNSLFHKTKI